MRNRIAGGALALAVALATALVPRGGAVSAAGAAHLNMAIQWNQTMLATFAAANVPPPAANRLGGIVAAATFDAVNGIERHYTPMHVVQAAPEDASPEAAAASGTYTALVALFPAQTVQLNAALANSIASLQEDDASADSIARGVQWGETVGGQIIAWRAADGFSTPPAPYVFQTAAGQWQPTPGGSGPPKFRTLATTTPFALTSPSQFRPAGPPALTSAGYAADLSELEAYGGQVSSVRTAYQTETARFWQLDTPTALWDRVADSLAMEHHFNLLKSSRLLALVNVALADSTFAIWDAKNHYNFWRPVTAIDTSADPTWQPLLVTPYFQEYPSAHSGVSSAAATILASFFGQEAEFTMTSAGLPGVERSFTSFDAAVSQVADARVFAGFHFRFSCDDGIVLGRQVASYVESNLMLKADGSIG